MWIRTQNLLDSFSSDNKKQKLFARNSASGKRFDESDLSELIDRLGVAVKPRTVYAVDRNFRRVAHLRLCTLTKDGETLYNAEAS